MRRYWIALIAVICCSLVANVYAATDLEVLKAAHNGDVASMRRIGIRMYKGCSRGNPTLGIEWLKKAVEHGDVEAMYFLGRIYQTKGNGKLAAEYLEQASEKGFEKATKALEKMPLEFSCEAVEKKAKSGDYKACIRLLKAYLLGGDGVEIDFDKAWQWYEQAGKLKSRETRETIKKWNASQTVPLWERIVDKSRNDKETLMHLAELYEKGADGIPKDEEKSKKYYQEAATAGDIQAVAWLKERGLTFETKAERDARIAREAEQRQKAEEVERERKRREQELAIEKHRNLFRAVQEVAEEQSDIVTTLSQIYGGADKVNPNGIAYYQRVKSQAEMNERLGLGGRTSAEAQADAITSIAASNEYMKNFAVLETILRENGDAIDPEKVAKGWELINKVNSGTLSWDELMSAASKAGRLSRDIDYRAIAPQFQQHAVATTHMDLVTPMDKAAALENADTYASRMAHTSRKQYDRAVQSGLIRNEKDLRKLNRDWVTASGGDRKLQDELFNLMSKRGNDADKKAFLDRMRASGASKEEIEATSQILNTVTPGQVNVLKWVTSGLTAHGAEANLQSWQQRAAVEAAQLEVTR